MNDHLTENVLCLKRNLLPPVWMQTEVSLPMSAAECFKAVHDAGIRWLPRDRAEGDPSYKQVIPYVVLRSRAAGRLACYRRKGSEKRLHDLWSIGIGGHVNPEDGSENGRRPVDIIEKGLMRELGEELIRCHTVSQPVFKGVINEERTDVGTVHLGLVYVAEAGDMDSVAPGAELVDFHWMEPPSIVRINLELWGRLALKLIVDDQPV